MKSTWFVSALVTAAVLLLAGGAAFAVPTVRGATGFIVVPDAHLTQAASVFMRDGKVGTSGTQSLSAMEGGILNIDGRNFYNAKLQLLPDITNEEQWIPGVALGVRGVSSSGERRDYYFLAQKHFTFPACTLVYGMNKERSWKNGHWKSFYGLEVPLFFGFSVLADHDGNNHATNAGVRWIFKKTFCVYDYVEDVRGKTANPKQNIIGACYQSKF